MSVEIVKLKSDTVLKRDSNGKVRMYYRGGVYAPGDVVPPVIYAVAPKHNKSDARAFVDTEMVRDYGTSKKKWPALAREFLSEKAG